jgi:hypothetical protein
MFWRLSNVLEVKSVFLEVLSPVLEVFSLVLEIFSVVFNNLSELIFPKIKGADFPLLTY